MKSDKRSHPLSVFSFQPLLFVTDIGETGFSPFVVYEEITQSV